jgi:uncharacterized protein with FMN-binding domain
LIKMAQHGANKKIANGLVAVSSAAVMAVYAAGYTRTQSAADKFEAQSAARRPGSPRPVPARSAAPQSRGAVHEVPQSDAAQTVAPSAQTAPPAAFSHEEAANPRLMASVAPPAAAGNAPVLAAAPSYPAPLGKQNSEPTPAPTVEHKAEAAPVAATPAPAPVQAAPVQAAPVQSAAVQSIVAPAPAQPANAAVPPWKDGTYLGWGTCRHGDLQAAVVIQGGKIVSAKVSECDTRYSCDIIDALPPQVTQRQSPEVDNVSGATQSADAFYGAVYNALLQAK